jgi:4-(cytidine 5'-diphospho)-2-C-methyl-D-erythritol kinase
LEAKVEKTIMLFSYAKINLSIDVGDVMPSGMHPVDMVMQQISLRDEISIRFTDEMPPEPINSFGANLKGFEIYLRTNLRYLPNNRYNLAWRAAELMIDEYGDRVNPKGLIEIFIKKRIPVAAGMAGGSGNAAAIMHGLNAMWELGLSLEELCEQGAKLGSDIPFCLMAQAKSNKDLPENIRYSNIASTCARARGTGTELSKVRPLKSSILVVTPRLSVSTRTVFTGIDECTISDRPNNDKLCRALRYGDKNTVYSEMINVLEEFTLKEYPEVAELKRYMIEICEGARKVLMSGSGPTVFAIFDSESQAKKYATVFKEKSCFAFWARTMI